MDLGIAGRWAIVCASTRGLGRACADALAAEGVNCVVNGRDEAGVHAAAAQIREFAKAEVVGVAADLTTADGRARLLDACPEPDILVTNNRGPKPGVFTESSEQDFEDALDLHFRAPLALVRAVLPAMRRQRWGRIVNVTSAMVAAPLEVMVTSAGARAGQTAVMKAISFAAVADGVTINNLLPERFATQRQIDNANRTVASEGVSFDVAWAAQAQSVAAKRHGEPVEFGATCAFICSVHAGFISGMNIHLDGGSHASLL